jgi:hypothetical protein
LAGGPTWSDHTRSRLASRQNRTARSWNPRWALVMTGRSGTAAMSLSARTRVNGQGFLMAVDTRHTHPGAPVPATPDGHPAMRWRGSPPMPGPGTAAPLTGLRSRRPGLQPPTAGHRCGCTRPAGPVNSGPHSTNGARSSPTDRIAPCRVPRNPSRSCRIRVPLAASAGRRQDVTVMFARDAAAERHRRHRERRHHGRPAWAMEDACIIVRRARGGSAPSSAGREPDRKAWNRSSACATRWPRTRAIRGAGRLPPGDPSGPG